MASSMAIIMQKNGSTQPTSAQTSSQPPPPPQSPKIPASTPTRLSQNVLQSPQMQKRIYSPSSSSSSPSSSSSSSPTSATALVNGMLVTMDEDAISNSDSDPTLVCSTQNGAQQLQNQQQQQQLRRSYSQGVSSFPSHTDSSSSSSNLSSPLHSPPHAESPPFLLLPSTTVVSAAAAALNSPFRLTSSTNVTASTVEQHSNDLRVKLIDYNKEFCCEAKSISSPQNSPSCNRLLSSNLNVPSSPAINGAKVKKKVSFNDSLLQVHLIPNLERYTQQQCSSMAINSQIDLNINGLQQQQQQQQQQHYKLPSPSFFVSDNDMMDDNDVNIHFPPPPPPPPPPPDSTSISSNRSSSTILDDLPPPPSPNTQHNMFNSNGGIAATNINCVESYGLPSSQQPVISNSSSTGSNGDGNGERVNGNSGSRANTPLKFTASGLTTTAAVLANRNNTPTLNHFTNSLEQQHQQQQQQPHFKVVKLAVHSVANNNQQQKSGVESSSFVSSNPTTNNTNSMNNNTNNNSSTNGGLMMSNSSTNNTNNSTNKPANKSSSSTLIRQNSSTCKSPAAQSYSSHRSISSLGYPTISSSSSTTLILSPDHHSNGHNHHHNHHETPRPASSISGEIGSGSSYPMVKAPRYITAASRVQSAQMMLPHKQLINPSSLNLNGNNGGGSSNNNPILLNGQQLRSSQAAMATNSAVRLSVPSSYPLEFTPHVRYLSNFKKIRQTNGAAAQHHLNLKQFQPQPQPQPPQQQFNAGGVQLNMINRDSSKALNASVNDNMVLSASSSHKHLIRQQQQQQQQQNPVKFIFLKSENQSKPPGKDVNSSGSTSTSNMPLVGFNTRSNTIANIERTNNTTAFNSASFESQPKEMMQKWHGVQQAIQPRNHALNSINQLLAFKDVNYYLQSSPQMSAKSRSTKPSPNSMMQPPQPPANVNYPLVSANNKPGNFNMLNNGNVMHNMIQARNNQQRMNSIDYKRSHSALPLVRHSQQVYLNALNANLQQQNQQQQQQQQQQPSQQQQQPQMQANFNNGLINGTNNYPYKMADQPPQAVQRANTFMYQPSTTTTTNNPINVLNSATLNRARYRGTSVDKAAF